MSPNEGTVFYSHAVNESTSSSPDVICSTQRNTPNRYGSGSKPMYIDRTRSYGTGTDHDSCIDVQRPASTALVMSPAAPAPA